MKLSVLQCGQFPSRIPSLPLLLTVVLAFFVSSCQETQVKKEAGPSITLENMQIAFAKATKYSRMYTLFVDQANKEHNKNTANLFQAIARSESIRAVNHAAYLRSRGAEPSIPQAEKVNVGTTLQTLKMAMSSEDMQYERMYPDLIRTAEIEKDTAATEQFKMAKGVDERHRDLLNEAINKAGKMPKTQFLICPGCGYIFTSDQTDECPICRMKKDKFEKI